MQKLLLLTFFATLFQIPLFAQTFVKVDAPDNPINSANIRGFYRGCAWVDIDNDGDLDLSSLTHAFRNEGGEQFSKIPSFGQATDFLGGISWADYGNDGDLDCLYNTHQKTIIYENDGTGNFTEKIIDDNHSLGS